MVVQSPELQTKTDGLFFLYYLMIPMFFGYLRNTWRLLSKCRTDEIEIPISFHLQRITKDLGVRFRRPKLELIHGEDYEEGKERVENYKQIASALKKRKS